MRGPAVALAVGGLLSSCTLFVTTGDLAGGNKDGNKDDSGPASDALGGPALRGDEVAPYKPDGKGKACVDGVCTPFEAVETFVDDIWAIAAGPKTGIVVGSGKNISICTVDSGCTQQSLITLANNLDVPNGLAVSDDTAFFHDRVATDNSDVRLCKLAGCGLVPVQIEHTTSPETVGTVVAGPNGIVWSKAGNNGNYISGCLLAGGCTTANVQSVRKEGPTAWAKTGANEQEHPTTQLSAGVETIFWGTGGLFSGPTPYLRYCKVTAGGCATSLNVVTKGHVDALTYYDGHHYVAASDGTTTEFTSISDSTPSATPKKIIADASGVTDLAVDGSGLYWVNAATNEVRRCRSLDTCANSEKIATEQAGLKFIEVDAQYIYWTLGKKVMKVAK